MVFFSRYIDAIIGISIGLSPEALKDAFGNVADDAIKLTWITTKTSLVALDVKISLEQGGIRTSLFRKPPIRPLDLEPPPLRIRRISSQECNFWDAAIKLIA